MQNGGEREGVGKILKNCAVERSDLKTKDADKKNI
jgi:hypothetical protein